MYEDFEVDDYNTLLRNENLIDENFGVSLSVTLLVSGSKITRTVCEDPTKIRTEAEKQACTLKDAKKKKEGIEDDAFINQLDVDLKNL